MKKYAIGFGSLLLAACTQAQAKTAENVIVRITTDLCTEQAQDPNEPDWVKLACKIEGPATQIVNVLVPAAQWHAIQASAPPHH